MLTCLMLVLLVPASDTLRIRPNPSHPAFDGEVREGEYGVPALLIPRPQGSVRVWAVESGGSVYLAFQLPDTSFYWGDDVVISLDVWGDRGGAPGHDDFQWYFRRALDSSVVYRGEQGKWRAPRDDPDWRLGPAREGGGWEVRAASDSAGWSLEFRLDRAYFLEAKQGTPAIAFRIYDDSPHGWHAWPAGAGVRHPTDVERRPGLWVPVILASPP